MNFRDTAPPQDQPTAINWRKRVQEYLETIWPWDPADDYQAFYCVIDDRNICTMAQKQRVKVLIKAAHDDNGRITLDGQIALLTELRDRAGND